MPEYGLIQLRTRGGKIYKGESGRGTNIRTKDLKEKILQKQKGGERIRRLEKAKGYPQRYQ